ncbi:MAG: zinc ABC transporter substrate-binding protein, partial [Planctomycetes bacterium]|nr:zinc ABC transporter substrate-binding protein [Planctomycetota bacterium]
MKWFIPSIFMLAMLAGCGSSGPKPLKEGEKLRVMASTPHLASLAMAIAGEDAQVDLLPADGGNPHEYEPTIADRRRLQDSHLLLVNGLGLEPFDAKKLAEAASVKLVNCSSEIPESWLLGDEDEHDEDHDHGAHNPHVWLSIEGAMHQAATIAKALSEIDQAHAPGYALRLAKLEADFNALREEFQPKVKALKRRKFVSNHDAFPYFAREFGLEQVGVIQRTPGSNPTVEERREIESMLKEGGADAIFMEPGFDDAASRAIA